MRLVWKPWTLQSWLLPRSHHHHTSVTTLANSTHTSSLRSQHACTMNGATQLKQPQEQRGTRKGYKAVNVMTYAISVATSAVMAALTAALQLRSSALLLCCHWWRRRSVHSDWLPALSWVSAAQPLCLDGDTRSAQAKQPPTAPTLAASRPCCRPAPRPPPQHSVLAAGAAAAELPSASLYRS